MILVDSSVWIDHLRANEPVLSDLLERGLVLGHPFVVGELACGNLRNRAEILSLLGDLPQASVATDAEVLGLIERYRLMGRWIGWVDAHLLASVLLTPDAGLWTRDGRLAAVATELDLASD